MERVRWADGRDLLVRVVGPAFVLWILIVCIGLVITGPLAGPLSVEDAVNQALVAGRGGPWDTIAVVSSYMGSTELVVGVCIVVSVPVLWSTRDWRLAVVPWLAILLQLSVYLGVTALVHRERPSVDRLETLPPMSSYPSGHVGASTALCVAFLLLASRIERTTIRWAATTVCITVPLMVAFGRLFRGMHHVTDVVAGLVVGAVCALLARSWYAHRTGTCTSSHEHTSEQRPGSRSARQGDEHGGPSEPPLLRTGRALGDRTPALEPPPLEFPRSVQAQRDEDASTTAWMPDRMPKYAAPPLTVITPS